MNRKRLLIICCLMALCMVLWSCKKAEDPKDTKPTETPTETPTDTPTNTPDAEVSPTPELSPTPEVTPTPEATPTPEGMTRSALTNEWIPEELANRRPVAVMMNNVPAAVPQAGINSASIVYECSVEYNDSRLMAIIEDYDNLEKIGSVRSCRAYYVFWALEWDALYCHFGGPKKYVDELLARDDVNNINGIYLEGLAYYRTSDRKAPHNAYTSAEGIRAGIKKRGYATNHTDRYIKEHFQFAPDEQETVFADGIPATSVKTGMVHNKPEFIYNEEDGLYYREQYGEAHVDELDGKQISTKNIIIQFTGWRQLDHNDYLAFDDIDSGKGGYYITNGKAIPITWSKKGEFEPTKYFDMNGNEIQLNTGKTWICVVKDTMSGNVEIK